MPENQSMPEGKYIASVKIGPKGQIVIPKEVRDMFRLSPGDTVLLLADINRGIAINTINYFDRVADAMYSTGEKFGTDFKEAVDNMKEI